MHQNAIGLEVGKHRFQPLQDGGSDIGQILAWFHDVEVIFWRDFKQIKHLIQHLSVLAGHADSDINITGSLEGLDDWRHLNRLWSGTKYDQHPLYFYRHKTIPL